jgi:transglutaminase-like putative cysteine protease
MIVRGSRVVGFAALLCFLFAMTSSAFTCDDINPKTGTGIISYLGIEHKLSSGRDVITTSVQTRFCKKVMEDEQQIPLITNANYGSLGLLDCYTVKDGKRSECDDDLIDTYRDGVVIRLPSMVEGDSIEYSYQEEITFPVEGEVWSTSDIYLEAESPIEKVVLKIEVPEKQNFRYYSSKQEPLVSEDGGKKVYTWEGEDVPYFELEPLMPPTRHSLSRVSFTSFDSWDEIEEWFEKLFREVMKEQYVGEKVEELTENYGTDREKVDAIYAWVRDNITYEEYGFTFLSGYKPRDLDDTLSYKSGDCKGQTALLATMLKSAGIEAHPVVVSYRDITRDVPGPYSFFHTLVYVPDIDDGMWLDPTCYYCPAGYLPTGEQNMNSLILFDGKRGFTPTLNLPPEQKSKFFSWERDNLSEDGSVAGEGAVTYYGDMPYMYQYIADRVGTDSLKALMEEAMDTSLTGKCGEVSIPNLEIEIGNGSMDLNFTFTCKRFATRSGKKLVISSGADELGGLNDFVEVISKDERRFPIRISYDTIFEMDSILQLPPCYGIEEFPEREDVDESFITVIGLPEYDSDNNAIESKTMIRFRQDEIPAENFAEFKEIVSNILEPTSIIIYPQGDDVSGKIQEVGILINMSAAEDEEKALWKNRTLEIENLLEEGRCQKALDELSDLDEAIKNYKPDEVETDEPSGEEEKGEPSVDVDRGGQIPTIAIIVVVAALFIVAFFVIRGRSR